MTTKSRKFKPTSEWQVASLFALTVAGYPLAGLAAIAMNVDSLIASVPFRILVVVLALLLLLHYGLGWRVTMAEAIFSLFLAVYIARLIWDANMANLPGAEFAALFFVATGLLPSLAQMATEIIWPEDKVMWLLLVLCTMVVACALILHWGGFGGERDLAEATGRLSFETVNPITIGHVCVSAIFAAYCCWIRYRNWPLRFLLGIIAIVSLYLLGLTGSKGPALSLTLVLLVMLLRRRSFLPLAIVGFAMALLGIMMQESSLQGRIESSMEDESTAIRLQLIETSIQQIAEGPWIGSAYLNLSYETYPHNILLETALALGMPMLLFLISLIASATFQGLRQLRNAHNPLLFMIFLQFLIAAMLSSSIWGASALWISLAALLASRKYNS
jgi:O-antigen ligase